MPFAMFLPRVSKALLAGIAAALLALAAHPGTALADRQFVDSAGRTVTLPDTVSRVLPAGPPASVAIYTLAPDKLLGWSREPAGEAAAFIAEPYRNLPRIGRLAGSSGEANVEAILAMKPDVIVDIGTVDPTYASLADRIQTQTGIPYVLIDGAFLKTPSTYRLLGEVTGDAARAEELAGFAEATLEQVEIVLNSVPEGERPLVYYGRGPEGLETGLAGSINVEILEAVGARNVAAAAGTGGLTQVSPEQILAWNPEIVLGLDGTFVDTVGGNPLWANVRAIADGKVYLQPGLPFGWFDSPPGVNRLIGVHWLLHILYPDEVRSDLRAETRSFYEEFYHVTLSEAQLDRLLGGRSAPPR